MIFLDVSQSYASSIVAMLGERVICWSQCHTWETWAGVVGLMGRAVVLLKATSWHHLGKLLIDIHGIRHGDASL